MHASDTAVHWMAAAYALTFALLLITSGRLGEVLGYKRLFLAGVARGELCPTAVSQGRSEERFLSRTNRRACSDAGLSRPAWAAGCTWRAVLVEEFAAAGVHPGVGRSKQQ